ncbi:MAG TPA: response regulator [Patescibacteria group bacterium]|nr:response regulator [Patescibacteria group bacterium]
MAATKGLSLDGLASSFLRLLLANAQASGGLLVSRRGVALARASQSAASLPLRLPPLLLAEVLQGRVVTIADVRLSSFAYDASLLDRPVSVFCAPVTWSGRVQAILYMEREAARPFAEMEVHALLDMTGRAGLSWPSAEADYAEELPPLFVLLVEDNDVNRKVAKAFLERSGHSVSSCSDGAQAVVAVEEGDFDVVLMDIRMPGMDGIEATRHIRALADPRKARIPILALTANFSPAEVERYMAVGMNAVVRKPLHMGAIEEALAPLFAVAAPSVAEAPAAAEEAIEMPILDTARIALLADAMDAQRLLELCDAARDSIRETAEELSRHWQAGDKEGIARDAHRLCGVASNFGCAALAECAAAVENDCRAGGDGHARSETMQRLVAASLEALPHES